MTQREMIQQIIKVNTGSDAAYRHEWCLIPVQVFDGIILWQQKSDM